MKENHLIFSDLTLQCKKALMEYCSMEEIQNFQELEEFYKDRTFKFEEIDVEEAKKRCMKYGCGAEYTNFEEYHKIYVGDGRDIPNHGDSMYPVIESCEDEWLEDGWHRFHSYIKYEKKVIPILSIH